MSARKTLTVAEKDALKRAAFPILLRQYNIEIFGSGRGTDLRDSVNYSIKGDIANAFEQIGEHIVQVGEHGLGDEVASRRFMVPRRDI